jgi:hypothetical protein
MLSKYLSHILANFKVLSSETDSILIHRATESGKFQQVHFSQTEDFQGYTIGDRIDSDLSYEEKKRNT